MSLSKLLYGGLASYLPRRADYSMTEHPVDARYGYSVWMRHLATLEKHGVRGPFPTVVELGPGNSIATGVSALLSGADRYIGLDVLEHIALQPNLAVLDQVQDLFLAGADIPDATEYPALCPKLETYAFPSAAFASCCIDASNDSYKIQCIREAVRNLSLRDKSDGILQYQVPWQHDSIAPGSVDLVFTQAVMQEIPHDPSPYGLSRTIEAIAGWLRPGAVVSHQIDLGIYGIEPWNIHWKWSGVTWTLVRGRRQNFVNREPLSTYVKLLRRFGLKLIATERVLNDGIARDQLAPRYRKLSKRDLRTRSVTLIAIKL